MNKTTFWIILILAIAVMIIILPKQQPTPAPLPPIPQQPTAGSRESKDIADAQAANANITCIALMSSGISPYDNLVYQVGSPCDLDWLVTNRNWTKIDTTTQKSTNRNRTITILGYSPR